MNAAHDNVCSAINPQRGHHHSAPETAATEGQCVCRYQEHDDAVRKLKDALINATVLRFFDTGKRLVIQVNASKVT